jgi:hypothetical protein
MRIEHWVEIYQVADLVHYSQRRRMVEGWYPFGQREAW